MERIVGERMLKVWPFTRGIPRPNAPQKLRLDFFDRHAEHFFDPDTPLCDHKSYELLVDDTFHGTAKMDVDAWLIRAKVIEPRAEFEIKFIAPGHIRVIINMPDYLAAKKAALDQRDAT